MTDELRRSLGLFTPGELHAPATDHESRLGDAQRFETVTRFRYLPAPSGRTFPTLYDARFDFGMEPVRVGASLPYSHVEPQYAFERSEDYAEGAR